MDFSKALQAMKVGKKVRRTNWNHSGRLSIGAKENFGKEIFTMWHSELNSNSCALHVMLTEEIFAENWEIIDDTQKVKIELTNGEHHTCSCYGCANEKEEKASFEMLQKQIDELKTALKLCVDLQHESSKQQMLYFTGLIAWVCNKVGLYTSDGKRYDFTTEDFMPQTTF